MCCEFFFDQPSKEFKWWQKSWRCRGEPTVDQKTRTSLNGISSGFFDGTLNRRAKGAIVHTAIELVTVQADITGQLFETYRVKNTLLG